MSLEYVITLSQFVTASAMAMVIHLELRKIFSLVDHLQTNALAWFAV